MTVTQKDKLNYYYAMSLKKIHQKPTPATLEEAVHTIIDCLDENITNGIKNGEITPAGAHFGFGRWMRNNWGLWGGSELQEWFHQRGIRHADDMSGIILETLKREICGEDWDVEGQVDHYRSYWKDKDVNPDKIGKDNEDE